jgi:insecticidal toxin complex protein TccC
MQQYMSIGNTSEKQEIGNAAFSSLKTSISSSSKNAQQGSTAKIAVQQLNLPAGGGAIQGMGEKFQTNEFTGTASLSLPIPTTPCRDITPQLNLNYSSGNGNAPWGLGWSVDVPAIRRKTSKGLPQYTAADTFLFGRDDLIPLDQQTRAPETLNGIVYDIVVYYSRNEENFDLIEFWQPQDETQQSAAFWKVTTADHEISIFGYNEQAKIADPANPDHIFTWLLEESYNSYGDHQLFFYKPENTDNVPAESYEQNRVVTANRYLRFIRYGHDQSVAISMVLTRAAIVDDPTQWHFEIVFDYGEYDVNPNNLNPYQPVNKWHYRPDPFSIYVAGFEIRTYRRCVQTLLFHRFQEISQNPALVDVIQYIYQPNSLTLLSQLTSVTKIGYQYQSNTLPYLTKAMPELLFAYTDFQPAGHGFVSLGQSNGQFLPGLDQTPYALVDLYGQGIPGILYSDGQTTYYQSPVLSGNNNLAQTSSSAGITIPAAQSKVAYSTPQQCAAFPLQRVIESGDVSLMDITGDGQLDIVVSNNILKGYYEAQANSSWEAFQPFETFPADYAQPNQQFADLTGNGLSDLIMIETPNLRVYPSLGKQGFGTSWLKKQASNFPAVIQKTEQIWVTFRDMAGGGTPNLVRIEKDNIIYWPSIGYGNFGEPISMGNVPDFGDDFDTSRLFLVDIDGSGTTDLVYVYADKIVLYLNQSGNKFSQAIEIEFTPPIAFDSLDQISFADVYGRGTSCLVLSIPHTEPNPTYWCYDFCQQLKPYLLAQTDNNLGAQTTISYRSSVDYYLADQAASLPWITSLPFPVQVVAQVTYTDAISATTYVNLYAYHHGYYDGEEQEFRGFGRVDRQDCETINEFTTDPNSYQTPPILTKTWYHTGVYLKDTDLTLQYQKEYWQGDIQAYVLPPTIFDYEGLSTPPTDDDERLAYVALYGVQLRTEVYGLDGSQWQNNPYIVEETRMQVNELQAKGNNRYAVFLTYELETIAYDYERNAADPHCGHHFVLAINAYGHVLQSCDITYGRRFVPKSQPQLYNNVQQTADQQTAIRFVYAENAYINRNDPDTYLLGVEKEAKSYEIKQLTPQQGNYFTSEKLMLLFAQGIQSLPPSSHAALLAWTRYYYYDPVNQKELTLGDTTLQALHCRSEFVEILTDNLPRVLQAELSLPNKTYGYIEDTANQCYWNPGAFQAYFDQSKFYLPAYYCDPLHYQDWQQSDPTQRIATTYAYDNYALLVYQVIDPLGNQVTLSKIDYQTLQPTQMIDPNDNITEVLLDPLGIVIAASHYGTEGGRNIGFASLDNYIIQTNATVEDIINHPSHYLQQAAAFFYYDLFAWKNNQTPVYTLFINARQYTFPRNLPTTIENPEIGVFYTDGFSRTLQIKLLLDQPDTTVRYWDTTTHQVENKTMDSPWLTSGAVQYNNKGNPVKEYEPFFSDTYQYIDQPTLNEVGVSDCLYYDALDRAVLTITAMGYLEKTLFGYLTTGITPDTGGYLAAQLYDALPGEFQPSSWHTLVFDANDAIKQSPYYQHASAEQKAELDKLPYNTPVLYYHDSLDRPVQSEQLCVADIEKRETYIQLDIVGNALTEADGRLFSKSLYNFQTTYNLTQKPLQKISLDNGTQWFLFNVRGNPCYYQDSRQFIRRSHYDNLQRPIATTVTGGDGSHSINSMTEQIIYGESLIDPETWNLRGMPVVHLDQSGLNLSPFFTIDDQPLSALKALCADYTTTPNWQGVDSNAQRRLISAIEQLTDPSQLASVDLSSINSIIALELEKYIVSNDYNAVEQVIQNIDPDNNITTPLYYINGWLKSNQITNGPSITSITYNARGQRDTVVYGSGVTTTYTYDTAFRLLILKSICNNAVLQNYTYAYDGVNNILSINRNNISTIFFNNQQVDASSFYTYDSLYRLATATGREHIGNGNSLQHSLNRSRARSLPLNQPMSNGQALQPYQETYQYDAGDNLTQIQHNGAAANSSWTRTHTISDSSNQLTASTRGDETVDYSYDANGNMAALEGVTRIVWNDRDNIQTAIIIDRDTHPDAEYYVYDSSGQRVRKVFEQQTSGTTYIKDVIYLGNYEIRRNKTISNTDNTVTINEDWRVIRFMDNQACVAVWRYYIENGERATSLDQNQQRYQLLDHLNSSLLEVDSQGQIITYEEYYPFGGTALMAATNELDASAKYYRYSFKEQDNTTGLYYYGMRYYPPWLGRWLNPDPAGAIDGLNLYAFVGGNPTTHIDVNGLMPAASVKFKYQQARACKSKTDSIVPTTKAQKRRTSKTSQKVKADHIKTILTEIHGKLEEMAKDTPGSYADAFVNDRGGLIDILTAKGKKTLDRSELVEVDHWPTDSSQRGKGIKRDASQLTRPGLALPKKIHRWHPTTVGGKKFVKAVHDEEIDLVEKEDRGYFKAMQCHLKGYADTKTKWDVFSKPVYKFINSRSAKAIKRALVMKKINAAEGKKLKTQVDTIFPYK